MLTEPTLNTHLASVLRGLSAGWETSLRSQQTRLLRGGAALQPDIAALSLDVPHAAPVIVEAEVMPATSVEAEARDRLGGPMEGSSHPVETVVALRYPERLRHVSEHTLPTLLKTADDLEWAVLREGRRLPGSGWMTGSVTELADVLETAAVSPRLVSQAAAVLQNGVEDAAELLAAAPEAATAAVAAALSQEACEQTWRMASSILVNACLFTETVAGFHGTPTIAKLRDASVDGTLTSAAAAVTWRQILDINYWPIFHIAKELIVKTPAAVADAVLERCADAALRLCSAGVAEVQGLIGQLFGELIADRKFLATFYTLPSSAALLAELAVSRLTCDWSDPAQIAELRCADFACGTGALLSAVYERIGARARREGVRVEDIHSSMMERCLIGVDIMPAAAHLTATMLSSVCPGVGFGNSGIHVAPYGADGAGIQIGSSELLGDAGMRSLFHSQRRLAGHSDAASEELSLEDRSCDLVIMNPPFTSPTNHERADRLKAAGLPVPPVPSFAGFATSEAEQRAMSARLKQLRARTPQSVGNGHAGLGSDFFDLAHAKLRPGGVLGLVLLATVTSGSSWQKLRDLLDSDYEQVQFVGLANAARTGQAFSDDTDMAESLIVARKRDNRRASGSRNGAAEQASWVSLNQRPYDRLEAVCAAREITRPAAGARSRLTVGYDPLGHVFEGRVSSGLSAVSRPAVAEAATALADGRLLLAACDERRLPICELGQALLVIATVGSVLG